MLFACVVRLGSNDRWGWKEREGESRHGCKKAAEGGKRNVRPLASVYYRFPKLISNSRESVVDGRRKGSRGKKGEDRKGPKGNWPTGFGRPRCFNPRVLGDP